MNVNFYLWWFGMAVIVRLGVLFLYQRCHSRIQEQPEYIQRFMKHYRVFKYVWYAWVATGIILLIVFPFE